MRGIFAAGVLDAFLAKQYCPFDVCYGVSAGATALAAYLSSQSGRTYTVITDISCRPEFISFGRFLRGGHWLDLDWLWPVSLQELPFDMATFRANRVPLYITTTRVSDGRASYFLAKPECAMTIAKASCSVPLAYRGFVDIAGEAHTDGGAADSIPVLEAYARGARHLTVVLSQPWGYRKHPSRYPVLLRLLLRKTPALAQAMLARHIAYNAALDFIASPPADCTVELIAPPSHFAVGRLTRDKARLDAGYQMGLCAGEVAIRTSV